VERFFRAVRAGDLEQVRQLLDARPALAHAVRTPPPKKDAGQGPLGIAIKTGHLDIARLLVERGADVNFIEDPSVPGRMPVIADAIESAIVAVVATSHPGRAAETLEFLQHLIACGARTDEGVDEGVRPMLFRAVGSTLHWRRAPLSEEERDGVAAVFRVLVDAGARLDVTVPMGERRVGLREYLTRRVPVAYPAVPTALLGILEELAPPGAPLSE
jgi:ankyrin repeat protein